MMDDESFSEESLPCLLPRLEAITTMGIFVTGLDCGYKSSKD